MDGCILLQCILELTTHILLSIYYFMHSQCFNNIREVSQNDLMSIILAFEKKVIHIILHHLTSISIDTSHLCPCFFAGLLQYKRTMYPAIFISRF